MDLKHMYIHNTLTKKKEEFIPLEPGTVSMYHCGPTVYWVQHIGNMRAVFFADMVVRTFRYLGYTTKLVRNYTDVGHLQGDNQGDADTGLDRMEAGAKREGLSPDEIAQKYIDIYKKDIEKLGTLKTDFTPRATEHIDDMISMVNTLLEKGFAYATPSAIYFDISKVPNYTKLSGQKLTEQQQGTGHGTVSDSEKRNDADFALWFFKTGAHKNALQTWESPFESPSVADGRGFPGWHIECSAMSKHFLGNTFDIHMGGIEHIPVHHTNEIAQSESANGVEYVKYWLHNEHLLVDGSKMSKSEGTSFTIDDIIVRGYNPLTLRFFFLQAHYRSKQNFTWEALEASNVAYTKLRNTLQNINLSGSVNSKYKKLFTQSIEDDFNTSSALAVVFELLKDTTVSDADKKSTILDFDKVLGLELHVEREKTTVPKHIIELADRRLEAKKNKNWEEADTLRTQISKEGYIILDTQGGYKIVAL